MQWQTYGEHTIYDSPWVRLTTVDVDVPGQGRIDHHVIRMPAQAAGCVVVDDALRVLLLWRHRFITDTWGWEVPAGRIDDGESPAQAARRETLEESGWRVADVVPLVAYQPSNGLSDQVFHLFWATGAEHVGPPSDPSEADRIAWVDRPALLDLLATGGVRDGLSLTALLYALQLGPLRG